MQNWSPAGVEPTEFRPNVVPRARLRNILWPSEGEDVPDLHPLSSPIKPVRPPLPILNPHTVQLRIRERASMRIEFGVGLLSVYKLPSQTFLVLSDQAHERINGTLYGSLASVYTPHTFLHIADKATESVSSTSGTFLLSKVVATTNDKAAQQISLPGSQDAHEFLHITDKAIEMIGGSGNSSLVITVVQDKSTLAPSIGHGILSVAIPYDSFETYSDGDVLAGLNGGVNWNGAYIDHPFGVISYDTFETYNAGDVMNGLAGGVHFNGAFVERPPALGLFAFDSFESYTGGASLSGLNAGTMWNGAYVDH